MTSQPGMSDVVLGCVMPYIDDPKDRDAVSLVCRRWYELDALTRKHITIALCYTTSPDRLRRRFRHLESLKLKGKPRAAMFNLIPEDWGGYVTPWVNEIAENFNCLKAVHFRRMIVKDSDLEVLARSRGKVLQVLKLDKCSGFSTDGLLHVGRLCRWESSMKLYAVILNPESLGVSDWSTQGRSNCENLVLFVVHDCGSVGVSEWSSRGRSMGESLVWQLRTLFLEESSIIEKDGQWLHELAVNNSVLTNLNFYMTDLVKVSFEDLEFIAQNCRNLASVKISDCEILDLVGFFHAASVLEEFCGGLFNEQPERYTAVSFPPRLCRLGLTYMGKNEMPIVFPFASLLKKLDLLYALLDTEDHCLLIQRCPNLEVLELRRFALYLRPGGLTDVGLGYIGQYSSKVRWMLLGYVGESDSGLLEFSKGCPSLQKLEMRGCCFTERALAASVMQLTSLRYLWVQGYRASESGHDLLAMARPFWNIELIPRIVGEDPVIEHPAHILAYYSLAGPRTDFPESVIPLDPSAAGISS
ncbi:hypothetical protein GOBAR_AA14936 [Gossypium barbadense]|uniref:Coronatine-insensitive protein 1 n=1 Tax=Gossypium barbadense TaxID=3634 RepID=A0A2P5XQU2_GOSBA|nr:hypothetical protein GOBAR_AA14936 [Gossypium barbadense]